MEKLFAISSYLVMPFWALMIFLPRWSVTGKIMKTPLSVALPAVFYAGLVLSRLVEVWTQVSRPGLSGIAGLLGSPAGATIAWLHFLAFDLFVGRWIYIDSRERGISAWLMAPVLYLTLMLGPCGFLLYLLVRRVKGTLPRATNALPVTTILK